MTKPITLWVMCNNVFREMREANGERGIGEGREKRKSREKEEEEEEEEEALL